MKAKFKALLFVCTLLTAFPAFAAEQVFFYHTDPAGTPLAMTDTSGNVVWRADYKPFGEENTIAESQENDKRFVGKEKDEETGHYYFGARYMDPKTGRFIAIDPVRAVDPRTSKTNEALLLNPQNLNPYAYSLNNPYRYVDPDGNTVWDIMDFAFFGNSAYKFARDPSWSNAGDLTLDTVGLLPMVPSIGSVRMVGKGISKIDEAVEGGRTFKSGTNLVDGMKMSTNQAFDAASEFLGKGYKDKGKGRFVSEDGMRQVRMGDSDILGKHGGGAHINFDTFKQPIGKGSKPETKHIYLQD